MTLFAATYAPYATTKELKKNAFTINSQNINQEIGIQVTFILYINL